MSTEVTKLKVLKEIIETINRGKGAAEVLELLYDGLKDIIPYNRIAIALLEDNRLTINQIKTDGEIHLPVGYSGVLKDSTLEKVFKIGEPRIINNLEQYLENKPSSESTKLILEEGMFSSLTLPLIVQDKPIGVVFFSSRQKNSYTDQHTLLLSDIAGQVAIAVERGLLIDQLEKTNENIQQEINKQTHELKKSQELYQFLLDITNAINSSFDITQVFKTVIDEIHKLRLFNFTRASITLIDEAAEQIRFITLFPEQRDNLEKDSVIPLRESAISEAYTKKQPVINNDLGKQRKYLRDDILYNSGISSYVFLPLVLRGSVIGSFNILNNNPDSFTPYVVNFLAQIANQMTIAVSNAKAYTEIEQLKNELQQENIYLKDELVSDHHFYEIIGSNPTLLAALRNVEKVAMSDSTVLIRGETGTGKELIARAIHRLSSRRDKALIKVNCAALPETLIASELFGHERGAFTGAISRKIGRFELAHGGTIFLDETGDINLDIQAKILRVLQEKEVERVGGTQVIKVDVRIIAATNKNLEVMISKGTFRDDLYYRLSVFPIFLPPLRERKDDIRELTLFFINKYARKANKNIRKISQRTMDVFYKYDWPGNIRELENVIERAVIFCDSDTLDIQQIEFMLKPKTAEPKGFQSLQEVKKYCDDVERSYLKQVLKATGGKIYGQDGAAVLLGLRPTTLQSRLKRLGINPRAFD